jgi:PAS domain S-box-containing protein
VAVLLFHERRHWLAFVLAASLANTSFDLLNGQALHTSLLFFLGNSLEALAGAWLVRRFVAERPTLDSLREVVGFIVCSALISTTVSATLGAWVVTDLLKSGSYWHTWLLWFSGDVIGISLLSPLLMAWRSGFNHPAHGPWSRRSTHEAIFILAVTLGAVFLFNNHWHQDLALKYLMIPAVVFGAFAYGMRGATAACLVTGIVGAWMTSHGYSLISVSGGPPREQAIALQLFLAVVAFCGLGAAALLSERKLAEEKLLEAHQFNEQVIRSAREGIIVYGLDLRYQAWNPFMEQLTGLSASEVLGRHPLEVFPFLRDAGVYDRLEKALAGETHGPIDFFIQAPTPEKSGWASDNSAPFRSVKGEILGVIGTVSDISTRKRSEEAHRDSEQRLKKAQQVAHVGSWTWNIQTDRLDWSDEMYRIFGIQKDAFRGVLAEVIAQAIHPDDRAAVEQSNRLVPQEGKPAPLEYRILWPDGTVRFVWGEAGDLHLDEAGQPAILTGIVQDITERKQAEQSLRRTRLSVDSASDAMFWITPDARIVDVNEAACRSLGYSRTELLKLTVPEVDVHYDAAKWPEHFAELRRRGTLAFESEQRTREGRLFPVEIVANYVKFDGEEHNCAFVRDISERKEMEAETLRLQTQLQQAQKMESLGSLAGGVAHDMNNVLGAILGMATAHIQTQPTDSPTYRAFETIIQAASRGGKLVKGLLSFARQSPAEEIEMNINRVLREEAQLLERTTLANVRLEMDLASDLRPIRGDASALTHAFMNLCVNAVDAMPDKGLLTLRTRNVDNDWIEVMVEDTGTGMSKEVMEKALDPFFTTKEVGKGTGLGLSLVYSTVQAHKGQLEIESQPGQGTRVRMRFPACGAMLRDAELAATANAPGPHGALRVLLVDDDELIQSSMQAILEMLGHQTTSAQSGEAALAHLEAGLRPDVVILDMNMPGLGGAGTLPRLRALQPTLPVLLATGRIDQFALNLAKAHPFVALLSKPFSMDELQQYFDTLSEGKL